MINNFENESNNPWTLDQSYVYATWPTSVDYLIIIFSISKLIM